MKSMFKPSKHIKLIPLSKPAKSILPQKSIRMHNPDMFTRYPIKTERNDGPACSTEQMHNYRENWDKVLLPKVTKQLKKNKDIMHGSYSVNMQVTKPYRREAHDIDVWAKDPGTRAKEIEDEIDRCVGCDIAHVKIQKIGKSTARAQSVGPPWDDTPKDYFTRYTVITQPKNDVDVDFSTIPDDRPLKTRVLRGVRHEVLDSALERAYDIRNIPYRSARAQEDIKRIEGYMKAKKKKKK